MRLDIWGDPECTCAPGSPDLCPACEAGVIAGECPTCQGWGEVDHQLWGSPSCPEPTMACPDCGGSGEQ